MTLFRTNRVVCVVVAMHLTPKLAKPYGRRGHIDKRTDILGTLRAFLSRYALFWDILDTWCSDAVAALLCALLNSSYCVTDKTFPFLVFLNIIAFSWTNPNYLGRNGLLQNISIPITIHLTFWTITAGTFGRGHGCFCLLRTVSWLCV